ncbi:DNA gyrase inhibitory protein [Pediococcus acidilactici]|uniref:GyrI-like domain-containing protein n=1 Tax=Pediococcus TaxID=1253 RepID=UPI001322BFFD|nr:MULTISPECIES: GyrI-like domain-containing protein [Pediococcus]KAF0371387.1 DNA gyrase inhibitory protein [Pediococcus acidilactici]KAF0390245.1 DNA gyrase inhibitory protein [Pediococcus acidilactici]
MPIIEEFKDIKIAYMRRVGKYGPENKQLMENFKAYLKEKHLFIKDMTILGIALDNPMTTPIGKQRYDVGIIITDRTKNFGLPSRKISDGLYSIFEVAHTKAGVLNFWKNISSLTNNLPVDDSKPIIERYSSSKISSHVCEFCIPLK